MPDDPHSLHRIILIEPTDGRVNAQIIDNVHQFSVSIIHDGARATDIAAQADRFPWTSCPAGLARLNALVGTPVGADAAPAPAIDKSQQCTHLFDLAKLALAHARDTLPLRYDVRVHAEPGSDGAEGEIDRNTVCAVTKMGHVPSSGTNPKKSCNPLAISVEAPLPRRVRGLVSPRSHFCGICIHRPFDRRSQGDQIFTHGALLTNQVNGARVDFSGSFSPRRDQTDERAFAPEIPSACAHPKSG